MEATDIVLSECSNHNYIENVGGMINRRLKRLQHYAHTVCYRSRGRQDMW